MQIALGGGDISMSHDLLDTAQIHVGHPGSLGAEGMTQGMVADMLVNSGLPGGIGNTLPDILVRLIKSRVD